MTQNGTRVEGSDHRRWHRRLRPAGRDLAKGVRWLSRYRGRLVHSMRMTTAGTAAFVSAYALGLPEALSATITAIVVSQSNVGGSIKTAFDQFLGSVFGAVYATGVGLAIMPDDPVSSAAALLIALAPLSVLAARSPGFRIAPITAAVVLVGVSGLHLSPLDLGAYRIFGVGLGCGIGLLISILIVPARASRSVVETSARIVGLLAEQLQALAAEDTAIQEVLAPKATETRESLIRLAAFVEEATHERRAWLAESPDGQRILRTLRRVRHDVDMLRRAAREAGGGALHEHTSASWRQAARSGAATLDTIRRILSGEPVPDDVNTLAPAVRDYRAAVDHMRRSGVTHSLSTAELGRLFGVSFALDQLRRDLDDLIEVAREAVALQKRFAAGRQPPPFSRDTTARPSPPRERGKSGAGSGIETGK